MRVGVGVENMRFDAYMGHSGRTGVAKLRRIANYVAHYIYYVVKAQKLKDMQP